jgi:hypothetical protein
MNKTPRLTQRLAIALITLLLGGSTLTLWAQQEQQEPIEPAPPEQRETQDAEKTSATTSEETDADDSPFDYQSSEKISEDLSVSFPVDI